MTAGHRDGWDEADVATSRGRHHTQGLATATAVAALTGCGGGDAGSPSTPQELAARPQAVAAPLTPEDGSARFLAQAGLGATTEGLNHLLQVGADRWLQEQFAMPRGTPVFDLAVAAGFAAFPYQASDAGLDNVIWSRLFSAPDVLRQRIVLALSEIFVVSGRNMPVPWGHFACMAYWDLLEAHCFGSFATLLKQITLSPAMGVYLSMRGSRKEDGTGRRPDENFARELLQLFTIGLVALNLDGTPRLDAQGRPLDTYGNATITELAKVFTGWDFDPQPDYTPATTPEYTRRPMVFNPGHHTPGAKSFLGGTVPDGVVGEAAVDAALDIIVRHPNVGPFIAKQLIQKLITSNPEPAHVAAVARVFNDNGQGVRGDLQAVIRAVLMHPLARDPLPAGQAERRCKLREPVLRLVQWGRLAKLRSTDGLWDVGDLSAANRLAQSPLRSPSVFNFFRPGYVPLNTGLSDDGFVAPEFQITDESSVIGYANFLYDILPAGAHNVVPDYGEWLAMAGDPKSLVDRLNLMLTGRALARSTAQLVESALHTIGLGEPQAALRRVAAAFYLLMCSPDYLVQR